MKSFPTIDQCVMYLVSIGCKWNATKERKLNENGLYKYKGTVVFYDPYEILGKSNNIIAYI
jgi:hypothetical protein